MSPLDTATTSRVLPSFAQYPRTPPVYLAVEPVILPLGHAVVIAAAPGVGKGSILAWLAAENSLGRNLAGVPVSTISVSPEDHPFEVTGYRLDACGADDTRIFNMTTLPGGVPFSLDASGKTMGSIPQLSAKIADLKELGANPQLVTIDPLGKLVTAGSIQSKAGADRIMVALEEVAAEHGVCVLIAHHVTWAGKMAGSRGIEASARLVYRIDPARFNDRIKILSVAKANGIDVAGTAPVSYMITGQGTDARVVWGLRQDTAPQVPTWHTEAIEAGQAWPALPSAEDDGSEPSQAYRQWLASEDTGPWLAATEEE